MSVGKLSLSGIPRGLDLPICEGCTEYDLYLSGSSEEYQSDMQFSAFVECSHHDFCKYIYGRALGTWDDGIDEGDFDSDVTLELPAVISDAIADTVPLTCGHYALASDIGKTAYCEVCGAEIEWKED